MMKFLPNRLIRSIDSIGYAQWQVDRSQDEVYLSTQESAGQHRDAQGEFC